MIVFSSIFYSGVNLWNHVNDIEEDKIAGKKNILIENLKIRKYTIILVTTLYTISLVIVLLYSTQLLGIIFAIVVSLVTWIYSDKILLGRFIRRWKDHYTTELLTYIIATPTFIILLWLFFDKITTKTMAVTISMTFFMLSGAVLKDIKDTTSDELAGLKTLAVVFQPKTLLKTSIILLWIYYTTLVLFTLVGVYDISTLIALAPALGLFYATVKFIKNNWLITTSLVKPIKVKIYSNLLSVSLFAISGLLSPT